MVPADEDAGSVRLVRADVLKEAVLWDRGDKTADGVRKGRPLDIRRDVFSVPRIKLDIKHQKLTITRTQFPLSVAIAYSVHKAQGQTLGTGNQGQHPRSPRSLRQCPRGPQCHSVTITVQQCSRCVRQESCSAILPR